MGERCGGKSTRLLEDSYKQAKNRVLGKILFLAKNDARKGAKNCEYFKGMLARLDWKVQIFTPVGFSEENSTD